MRRVGLVPHLVVSAMCVMLGRQHVRLNQVRRLPWTAVAHQRPSLVVSEQQRGQRPLQPDWKRPPQGYLHALLATKDARQTES